MEIFENTCSSSDFRESNLIRWKNRMFLPYCIYSTSLKVNHTPSWISIHGEFMVNPVPASQLDVIVPNQPKKFLDVVREFIRLKHYSFRTEETYVLWIKRFILFHQKRHPQHMGATEIREFLSHLAVELSVSASTQNQAFHSLLFLYKEVLKKDIGAIRDVVRAKVSRRLPEVMTPAEVRKVLTAMTGLTKLMAELLYGAGLRLTELLRLRVKDLDFERNILMVRDGKGGKDRVCPLAEAVKVSLLKHLERALRSWGVSETATPRDRRRLFRRWSVGRSKTGCRPR